MNSNLIVDGKVACAKRRTGDIVRSIFLTNVPGTVNGSSFGIRRTSASRDRRSNRDLFGNLAAVIENRRILTIVVIRRFNKADVLVSRFCYFLL